jgi:hypothetical protein
MQLESLREFLIITISWSTQESPKIVLLYSYKYINILFIRVLNRLKYSNLLSGHAFYRMMNMRDEYLIHKTHRTFRAWLLPFALLADNLNAISCIYI